MPPACDGSPEPPPFIATAGATVAIGLLVAATLWSVTRTGPGVLVALDIVVALVALPGVVAILRYPVPSSLGFGLMAALSPVATPVASFALLFTARQRPFRQACGVAAVGAVGRAAQGPWRPCPGCRTDGGWR